MALLSSSCAWLSKYKEDREVAKKLCPRHGLISSKSEQNKISQLNFNLQCDDKLEEKMNESELKMESYNFSNKENEISIMETSGLSLCKYYKLGKKILICSIV